MSVALADLARFRETGAVIKSRSSSSAPTGYRFPREVIAVAVRWYLRYNLSYRDVEELLAERGRPCNGLPVGADVHDGVHRRGSTEPPRHRRPVVHRRGAPRGAVDSSGGERPSPPGCRSRPVEAGGSLIREAPGRVGSSPDNDETHRHCQTVRARLARRKGVREEPALQSPSSETTGSNLADVGWAAANSDVDLVLRRGARAERSEIWPGGHGEGLRRTRGWAAGA